MKTFIKIMILISVIMLFFNISKVDTQDLLNDKSVIALIGIIASLSAIVILIILIISRKIQNKIKKN
ncbi:MAG: hypothetical protein ACJ0P1_01575 [Flavobacteriaceae bacterium]|tara:strand:- start:1618 stop:1818 length:201 start_codon:yes stop_codon:yes gene_type:complete